MSFCFIYIKYSTRWINLLVLIILLKNTQQNKSLHRITINYAMQNLIANLTSVALSKFSNLPLSTEILQIMNKDEKKNEHVSYLSLH